MSQDRNLQVQARLNTSDFSVGDLARLTGVRPSAIRYYEACGLLPAPARRSGRRCYDRAAVERLRKILAARRFGFSIADLKRLASAETLDWQREAQTKSRSIKALIANLSEDAAQLDELSGCDCASGGVCRF